MMQKVTVSREFEARLRHAATGKLSLSTQQKMGTFFELGKDKAAKGEDWLHQHPFQQKLEARMYAMLCSS